MEELFYLYVSRIMFEANLVNLPKILDKRGNLSFIEEFKIFLLNSTCLLDL